MFIYTFIMVKEPFLDICFFHPTIVYVVFRFTHTINRIGCISQKLLHVSQASVSGDL